MKAHEKVNYLEFPAANLEATKAFLETVFCWLFSDFGADYCSFSEASVDGGFYRAELASKTADGGALVVFYSEDLETTQAKIEGAGGVILKTIFDFPGGRRFQFCEPSGNEFAVWSDLQA